MAYQFKITNESLLRKFAVYVVIAKGIRDIKLYVGKTGDNRKGCNPLISRCGNHFSFFDIHSQVRNKITDYLHRDIIYVFDHFSDYSDNENKRIKSVEEINEMERWLNQEIQSTIKAFPKCELVNPYLGNGFIKKEIKKTRSLLHTDTNKFKINNIIIDVLKIINQP